MQISCPILNCNIRHFRIMELQKNNRYRLRGMYFYIC